MKTHNRILTRLIFLGCCFGGGLVLGTVALQHRPGETLYNLFFVGALLLAITSFEASAWFLALIQRVSGLTFFLSGIGLLMVIVTGLMFAIILVPVRILVLVVQYLASRSGAAADQGHLER